MLVLFFQDNNTLQLGYFCSEKGEKKSNFQVQVGERVFASFRFWSEKQLLIQPLTAFTSSTVGAPPHFIDISIAIPG